MSHKGDCWDNAVDDKIELIYQKDYKTRKQKRQVILEYIAVYYNRIRMHLILNYKSPENYENERKLSKLCVCLI